MSSPNDRILGNALRAKTLPSNAHPSLERIEAFLQHRLDEEPSEAIREHVSHCSRCADRVLEFERFSRPKRVDDGRSIQEEQVYQNLQAALETEGARGAPVPTPKTKPSQWLPALAAALSLLSLGLGLWVVQLRNDLDAVQTPMVNVPIINLEPRAFVRGEPGPLPVAPRQGFVVILNPTATPPETDHQVAIFDAGDQRMWSGAGLRPTEVGNFHLELPANFLVAGSYRIELSRNAGSVDEFHFRMPD